MKDKILPFTIFQIPSKIMYLILNPFLNLRYPISSFFFPFVIYSSYFLYLSQELSLKGNPLDHEAIVAFLDGILEL